MTHCAQPAWKLLSAAEGPGPRSSHTLAYVAPYCYLIGGELEPRVPVNDEGHVWRINVNAPDKVCALLENGSTWPYGAHMSNLRAFGAPFPY